MTSHTIVIHDEPGGLWAEVSDLPGCFAAGATRPELDEALTEAIAMCE